MDIAPDIEHASPCGPLGFTVLPFTEAVQVHEIVAGFWSDCRAILGNLLPDHSKEIEALESHADTFWHMKSLSGSDFLRVQPDGFIILEVFRPGCHFTVSRFIGVESARETREFLQSSPLIWHTRSNSWKRRDGQLAESSDPDALRKFTWAAAINATHTLVWKWAHRNAPAAGKPFEVHDTLEVVPLTWQ